MEWKRLYDLKCYYQSFNYKYWYKLSGQEIYKITKIINNK